MLSDFILKVRDLEDDITKVGELLRLDELKDRLEFLELKFNHNSWVNVDPEELKEYNRLTKKIELYNHIISSHEDLYTLTKFAIEEKDEDLESEFEIEYQRIEKEVQELKLELMFSGKYDSNDVILSIHAGAGGKEAQDWCRMLLNMYSSWASKHDFSFEILDWQDGEDSSVLKSVSVGIKGDNVYGLLKDENGVHRLVRVSPFDSQNRRHTSFAAVEVLPEISMDNSVEIDPKDIRVDAYRASGAGGQHVNKTSSAIRLTHIPTGIVVACQQERSQFQNKDKAMKMLISKLVAIKEKEHFDNISEIQGEQAKIEWGSQIRSYVFMPYQMVKDHRTNCETSNINAVMGGDIDDFIFKSLAK